MDKVYAFSRRVRSMVGMGAADESPKVDVEKPETSEVSKRKYGSYIEKSWEAIDKKDKQMPYGPGEYIKPGEQARPWPKE